MKQKLKSYLFTNFNKPFSKSTQKNELVPKYITNLSTNYEIIEPLCDFSSFLEMHIENNKYESLIKENLSFLQSIINFELYEYFSYQENGFLKRLFAINTENKLFEYNYETNIFVDLEIKFDKQPKTFAKDNCLYFISSDDLMVIVFEDIKPITISPPTNIIDYSMYDNKVFFILSNEHFRIYYCETSQLYNIPNDYSNCYSLDLNYEDGKILKIVNFDEKLYVIQQYKITSISSKTDDIVLSESEKINTKIFENTIAYIDKSLIFYTENGLYLFDGNNNLKQIFKHITNDIIPQNLKGLVYNNKYYLKCIYNMNEKLLPIINEFDIFNNKFEIFQIDNINDISVIQTPNYYLLNILTYKNNQYNILSLNCKQISNNYKFIQFNKINFDTSDVKFLKDLKIQSHGIFTIHINSDIESYTAKSTDGLDLTNLNIAGHTFEFIIEGDDMFYISSILVTLLENGDIYD